jgi:N-methylhydantoinase A
LAFEFARSLTSDLNDLRAETVNAILAQLEADGQQLLRSAGVREVNVERSVDMCYLGQRFEVTTPIPYATLTQSAIPQLKTLFDQAYEKAYGRSLTELPARCVTWRVLSSGPSPKVALQSNHRKPSGTRLDPQPRKVVFPDLQSVECRIYRGDQLEPGISFDGPALIEEIASTIVVPPTAHVEIDEWDNVIIRLPPQN